ASSPPLVASRQEPAGLDRGNRLHDGDTLRTLDQDTVVPLDRAEAGLTVRIVPVSRLTARHLGHDGELHRLTVRLETDRGKRVITDNEHREDVVLLDTANRG